MSLLDTGTELIVAQPADKFNIVLYFLALVTDPCSDDEASYQAALPINVASIGFCQTVAHTRTD